MANYTFHPMTSHAAKMISMWQYEEPFSIYNMEDSEECIFLKKQFNTNKYQLVVAEFNERAIKVYERIGFIKGTRLTSKFEGNLISFVSMRLVFKQEQLNRQRY